ncbi:MAG TPA: hypothetical protein VLS93_09975 [Anaeromyxobacteraceae bacterium]|nr:hypothetical protein [Anaeromyxobacteraceae bacterium]
MDETTSSGIGGGARKLLAWLAILGLAAAVIWLLSERNARQYSLVPEQGLLVVKQGIPFVVGRRAFQTDDPVLAEAYAPLVPPPGEALPAERRFDDRSQLDQALFELLAGWAKADVASGDPSRLERGLGYLSRAEKLAGVSASQREVLASLRAESAWFEAQRLLGRGVESLRQAADKLRTASRAPTARGTEAQLLLRSIEPAVDAAVAALAAARGPAPAPPAGPAPPSPGPEGPERPDAPPQARTEGR